MKIASWNVNSIAVRLPHVLDWAAANRPDVLCLQETKCTDERFPAGPFREAGYEVATFGQPTYNGVAIISTLPVGELRRGLPDDDAGAPRRLLAATVGGVRVVNVYVPNGAFVGSTKFEYKLAWLARLRRFLNEQCDPARPLVLCGDFNIAPEDRDVHDPELWRGKVLFSEPEKAALRPIREWGLIDTFRLHEAGAGFYSWWDYRGGAFRRDQGLRIDHLWATAPLAGKCAAAWIDKAPRALERPSDHTPVAAEFTPLTGG